MAEVGEWLSYAAATILVLYAVVGSLAVAAEAPIKRSRLGTRLEGAVVARIGRRGVAFAAASLFFVGIALQIRGAY